MEHCSVFRRVAQTRGVSDLRQGSNALSPSGRPGRQRRERALSPWGHRDCSAERPYRISPTIRSLRQVPDFLRLSVGYTAAGTGLEVGVGVEGRPDPGGPRAPAWAPTSGQSQALGQGPRPVSRSHLGTALQKRLPRTPQAHGRAGGRGSGWGPRAARGWWLRDRERAGGRRAPRGRGGAGGGAGRVTRDAGQWGARPGPSLLRAFAAPAASREPRGVSAELAAAGECSAAATRGPAGERTKAGPAAGPAAAAGPGARPSPPAQPPGPQDRRGLAASRACAKFRWERLGEAGRPRGRGSRSPGGWLGHEWGSGALTGWSCGWVPPPLSQALRECPRKCRRSEVSPRAGPGIRQARGRVTPSCSQALSPGRSGPPPRRLAPRVLRALRAGPPIWRAPGRAWREERTGGHAGRSGAGDGGTEWPVAVGLLSVTAALAPGGGGRRPRAWCPAGSAPGLYRGV